MVLFVNVAALIMVTIAAKSQVTYASPHPQSPSADSAAPASTAAEDPNAQLQSQQPAHTAGEECDETKDRTACANESSLLFCSNNQWIEFSACSPGTVCKDGMCVHPGTESTEGTESTAESQSDNSEVGGAENTDATSSNPSQQSPSDAQTGGGEATDGAATADQSASSPAEAESTPESAESDSSSTDGGSGSSDTSSGDSGEHFGITCDKFSKAVTEGGKAISLDYPAPTDSQCQSFLNGMVSRGSIESAREAAMFLSNIIWESDGLRAKEEYACADLPDWCAQNYATPDDVEGKTYWGRGYIQLSWHYNYLAASEGLFGDDRLAKDPDQVAKDEDLAWAVSFWFWKDRVRSDPGVLKGEFGAAINMINGALECKGSAQDKAKKRFEMYKVILPIFAPDETPNETGCYN